MMGTGKAWAWHNRAKLAWIERSNMLPLESLEKVGAFAPTGSKIDNYFKQHFGILDIL